MNSEERLEYLRWRQQRKRSELAASNQKIAYINEKLVRLKAAKQQVDAIYQDMKILRKYTYAIRDKEEWKGAKKDSFMQEMDVFKTHFDHYVEEINRYYDEICNTITRLENERMSQESIVGGIIGMLNSLGNEIHKLIHS